MHRGPLSSRVLRQSIRKRVGQSSRNRRIARPPVPATGQPLWHPGASGAFVRARAERQSCRDRNVLTTKRLAGSAACTVRLWRSTGALVLRVERNAVGGQEVTVTAQIPVDGGPGRCRDTAAVRRRILLVEDEPGLRVTVGDRLRREGYDLAAAANGDEAFERSASRALRPAGARPDAARPQRVRGVPRAAPARVAGAGADGDGARPGRGPAARPHAGRRRIPLEAVRRWPSCWSASRPACAGVRAASRRCIASAGVQVDFRRAEVTRDGAPVALAAKELLLLRYFVAHRGELPTRNASSWTACGDTTPCRSRGRWTCVAWLRRSWAGAAPAALHPHGPPAPGTSSSADALRFRPPHAKGAP